MESQDGMQWKWKWKFNGNAMENQMTTSSKKKIQNAQSLDPFCPNFGKNIFPHKSDSSLFSIYKLHAKNQKKLMSQF